MSYHYSIIIPHYNDFKRLQRLLGSIPMERPDLQVLVIDDCSPKQNELEQFKVIFPEVEWYSTKKNSGAGCARNIGLKKAKGKFLVFADSDDEFTENAFDLMDVEADGDIELCYFLAEAVQETDSSPSIRADRYNTLCIDYLKNKTHENLIQLKLEHVIPCAKFYARAFILKTGITFDETRIADDVAFNVLAAFEAKNIQVVPKATYRIYRRGGSLTTNVSTEAFLTHLNIYANLATRLKEKGIPYRPSVTGSLLKSISYGPKVFLQVLKLALASDLKFDIFRIFSAKRWYRFAEKNYKTRKELKNK